MTKKITISLVIGTIAFFATLAIDGSLHFPVTTTEFFKWLVIIIATICCTLVPGTGTEVEASTGDHEATELGTVKWFNVKKGYGFITRDQGEDIFVHYRNIQGKGRKVIAEGQRVRFVVTTGDKGLQADQVEEA